MPDIHCIASARKNFPYYSLRKTFFISLCIFLAMGISCNTKPRETDPIPLYAPVAGNPGDIISRDLHEVIVREVLPAERYVYLKVQEGGHSYWIASGNQNAEAGAAYYYRESLLKTNFKSKVTGTTFDTLYLVTQLVPKEHAIGVLHTAN